MTELDTSPENFGSGIQKISQILFVGGYGAEYEAPREDRFLGGGFALAGILAVNFLSPDETRFETVHKAAWNLQFFFSFRRHGKNGVN